MLIYYEGHQYQWLYDGVMGVGRFNRKADEAVSLLETGSDCDDLHQSLGNLFENEQTPEDRKKMILDSIAEEYSYDD
ncbi:hypothetical protein [Maritalea mediterranea]|uniref:Uncharacterized protein n=1 Tax=Maritalea mediterranea TaxID=2909667 RepID=A0ABS9E6U6_9HYPH|nr:hypothetical protein [Maritalea mediterranea]MCF4098599.1 hypothetical protein [Maritalea mediterranea]